MRNGGDRSDCAGLRKDNPGKSMKKWPDRFEEKSGDPDVRALRVPLSDGMDFDTTTEYIDSYVKLQNTR